MYTIVPVILSGGVGSRLWPESRRRQPKQLSRLVGDQSLLQMTALRAASIDGAGSPLIVCGERHHEQVVAQLADVNLHPRSSILEPFGRNTAPAAAAAAMSVSPDDLILLLPADHLIRDTEAFVAAVHRAATAAVSELLVTFGITPTRAETGFGYIERGAACAGFDGVHRVDRFVEKPDAETAQRYVDAGTYSWNSGMFLMRAGTYLEELARLAPEIVTATGEALVKGEVTGTATVLSAVPFARCPSDSIDYAVMERTDHAAVVALDAGWDDVGSWAALWDVGEKDAAGNVVQGTAYLEDTHNSLIRSRSRTVAVVGMRDVIVVDTDDAVLVVHRDRSQDVKKIVSRLEQAGSDLLEQHPG